MEKTPQEEPSDGVPPCRETVEIEAEEPSDGVSPGKETVEIEAEEPSEGVPPCSEIEAEEGPADSTDKHSTDKSGKGPEGTKSTDRGEEVKPKRLRRSKRALARDACFILPSAVTDETCAILSESLKIIFNQTVNWKREQDYDDVRVM